MACKRGSKKKARRSKAMSKRQTALKVTADSSFFKNRTTRRTGSRSRGLGVGSAPRGIRSKSIQAY